MDKDIIFFFGDQKKGINIFIDINNKSFLQSTIVNSSLNGYDRKYLGGSIVLLMSIVGLLDATTSLEKYSYIVVLEILSIILGFILYNHLKIKKKIETEKLHTVIFKKKEINDMIKIKNITLIKGIIFFITLLLMVTILLIIKKNIVYLLLLTLISFSLGMWLKIYSIFSKEKKIIKSIFTENK